MCVKLLLYILKRVWDICKFTKFLEHKFLKIFHNVKAHWISIISPTKQILTKYKTLVIQMFQEQMSNQFAKANLKLLCNEVLLGFACIIPMLGCV
jgi:hypothetical protein